MPPLRLAVGTAPELAFDGEAHANAADTLIVGPS
jgi:hypothetical protein